MTQTKTKVETEKRKDELQPEVPEPEQLSVWERGRRKEVLKPPRPILRFSPTAWAKLLYFRDRGPTEIGGFGVAAEDDLLCVEEFVTVKQDATAASISFDDEAVADFFESQVDAGRRPEQFARIWLHTHPGQSPIPSSIDEETFGRVFGRCEWALMFVLGQTGKTYAKLRFSVGPAGEVLIPVKVDYSLEFACSDQDAWEAEYKANISASSGRWDFDLAEATGESDVFGADEEDEWDAENWMAAFEDLEPEDRATVLEELAARPDLWHEAEEVMPW